MRTIAPLVFGSLLSGCPMSTPAGPPEVGSTEISARTFTVDRIGAGDGALGPDGYTDGAFEAEVSGPIVALILSNVDAEGNHLYDQVWDTLVGEQPFPPEIGASFMRGGQTIVLGVEENGVLLNRPDGSIPTLAPGPHALTLWASPVVDFVTISGGYHYRVTAILEDGTLVTGPVTQHP